MVYIHQALIVVSLYNYGGCTTPPYGFIVSCTKGPARCSVEVASLSRSPTGYIVPTVDLDKMALEGVQALLTSPVAIGASVQL